MYLITEAKCFQFTSPNEVTKLLLIATAIPLKDGHIY